MNTLTKPGCFLLTVFIICSAGVQAAARQQEAQNDDLAAIKAGVQAYVDAVNRGDASDASSFWSETGQWIATNGEKVTGREAIRQSMEVAFADGPTQTIEVGEMSIKFLAPTVAMEEGTAKILRPGQPEEQSSYVAIHVKTADGWKLESVHETMIPQQVAPYERLKELEWMVGTWVDEFDEGRIETVCEWASNKSFLIRTFRVFTGDKVDLEGTQVVGWDANRGQIRSWVFDSDGGFGEGYWTRKDSSWEVDSHFTLPDGGIGHSDNRFTYVDEDTFTFESDSRTLDGGGLPSLEKITVKRVKNTQ